MTYSLPLLDKLTMYRLMLYGLITVWVAAIILCLVGLLPYSAFNVAATGLLFVAAAYAFNVILAKSFGAVANIESAGITALILTLIVGPLDPLRLWPQILILAAVAMASKYIIAVHRRHIFNPADVAVLVTELALGQGASWWVGNQYLLPLVAVLGLAVVARTRRWQQVAGFLVIAVTYAALQPGFEPYFLVFSPLWFFAAIMLTEPQTSPITVRGQLIFGLLVGALFAALQYGLPQYSYGLETSLLVGNLVSFVLWPAARVSLTFVKKQPLAGSVWSFTFRTDKPLSFTPGQFVELFVGGVGLSHHAEEWRDADASGD